MDVLLIYKITNTTNKKIYIGYTKSDIAHRWKEHCSAARTKSQTLLHKAIRKYSEAAFVIEKLYENDDAYLTLRHMEPHFIKMFDSYYIGGYGYNMTKGGDGVLGYVATTEALQKMSESHKGKVNSIESRKKMSEIMKGRKYSTIHRQRIADAFSKSYMVTFPDGHTEEIKNMKQFCVQHNLCPGHMSKVALGKVKYHKRFSVSFI